MKKNVLRMERRTKRTNQSKKPSPGVARGTLYSIINEFVFSEATQFTQY